MRAHYAPAVRLRIVGRSSNVGPARDPSELLEVLGDELRPVVGDAPLVKLLGPPQDYLDVRVTQPLSCNFNSPKGQTISVRTLNLNQDWQAIHRDLLQLIA